MALAGPERGDDVTERAERPVDVLSLPVIRIRMTIDRFFRWLFLAVDGRWIG